MAYSFHHPHTEVRPGGAHGNGLYATAPIRAGELLVVTGGRILSFESLLTHELPGHPIQVETDLVLSPFDSQVLDGIFTVNHSCDPNSGMRGQLSLVALRDIAVGEEICFDYAMVDSDPAGIETFSMHCLCKSHGCRGRVTDRDWRLPELRQRYRGYFASYLQRRIDQETEPGA
jgi:SET domain-containing protein